MRNIRWGVVTILAMLVTLFSAIPAVADAPEEAIFTMTRDGEVDPCTGEVISVDFTWTARLHAHNNNEVIRFDGVAEASNGSVANGTEIQVINKNWLTDTFNWVSYNEATGDRYTVKGRIKINLETGEFVKFDVDRFRCMGN